MNAEHTERFHGGVSEGTARAFHLIQTGAYEHDLRLIGDGFIGFKFVGDGDYARAANAMLGHLVEQEPDADWAEFLFWHADGGYDPDLWKQDGEHGQ